jgi:opine dehydrogenase
MKTICVIGAGNGGSAIAGDMTLAGHACRLFEFPEYKANLEPVIAKGGITVTGIARTGFAKLALATPKPYDEWLADGASDVVSLAGTRLEKLATAGNVRPLDDGIRADLDRYVRDRRRALG